MSTYINMRIKQSKAGNSYLFGVKDGQFYRVMKNKEGKNVLSTTRDLNAGFTDLDTLTAKEGNYGPYEFGKADGKVFFLEKARGAGEPVYRKDGSAVLDRDGNPLVGADFSLKVMEGRD